MIVLAIVAIAAAALVHVYIFVLEAVLWTTPRARSTFGTATEAEAVSTRLLALNQGFYNLFLAVIAVLGAGLLAAGSTTVGTALAIAATGSMLAAAIVLSVSMPPLRRPASVQGVFPVIALVALAVAR